MNGRNLKFVTEVVETLPQLAVLFHLVTWLGLLRHHCVPVSQLDVDHCSTWSEYLGRQSTSFRLLHVRLRQQPLRTAVNNKQVSNVIWQKAASLSCHVNQLHLSLRQLYSGTSSSISHSPIFHPSLSPVSSLCSSITPSLFHPRLKTYLRRLLPAPFLLS